MKKALTILIAVAILVTCCYFIRYPWFYERNYFEKIGVNGAWFYEDIIHDKGIPIIEEIVDEYKYVYYDGLVLVFDKGTKQWIMQSARITGDQYRFGLWHIGVGSARKEVESVYKNVKKMKDLSQDEFGVIDDGVWVVFTFDENNSVSKITLTNGF